MSDPTTIPFSDDALGHHLVAPSRTLSQRAEEAATNGSGKRRCCTT